MRDGKKKVTDTMEGFQEEHAVALVVLVALGLLIALRFGFRGVGVPLTNLRVGV